MSAEVLQSNGWVGPDFLRTKQFPFVPNTDVVDNTKLGVVTKGQDDDSISSLAASVTKPLKEQNINLIPFDKFSSYQKLLRVTAYMLRLLPAHESYGTGDSRIAEPVELEEAKRHLQYFLTTNPLRKADALLSLLRLLGLMFPSLLLVDSDG